MKKRYRKIVELPTGVTTKIKDTLEGRIEVEFLVLTIFNQPIENEDQGL